MNMENIESTITIGIPALNEEANIKSLLRDILSQNIGDFIIEKIIVVSDGSTDGTVEKAKSLQSKKVKIISNKERKGLAAVQNLLISKADSDILIILNADVRILDKKFIEKIARPIALGYADLVAPSVNEAEPQTFFEKILFVSTKIKNVAYESFRKGNNVYTCRGVARAFSRRLYTKMYFLASIGEDAFSYYFCIVNNFSYHFEKKAKVTYRLPGNYQDHKKQSLRFFNSQELLKREFGKRLITEGYRLNNILLIKSLLRNFISSPFYTTLYLFILFYLKVKAAFTFTADDKWEMATSSKSI